MTAQALRDFIRQSAEKPLKVHLADGATYRIKHPDFAFATLDSLTLASGPGHELGAEFVVCPLAHITRVEVQRSKLGTS